jgi:CDP-diacylglycerol---serine O-phosphatidyltransferase
MRARLPLRGIMAVDAPESKRLRHFSMIRDFALADAITLGNGVAGFGCILLTLRFLVEGHRPSIEWALLLLPVAGVFDYLDGRVARWRRKQSALGAQLDSLADLISFGVAPAVVGYALGLRSGGDAIILIYFVSCGLSRLARYNVTAAALADDTGKVSYFEGTPIPTSVGLIMVWMALYHTGQVGTHLPWGIVQIGALGFHPFGLLYAASGSAMISKTLKIPKP